MSKNINDEASNNKKHINFPLQEISVPLIVHRTSSISQITTSKSIPFSVSTNTREGLNNFLIDLEKRLVLERTNRDIKKIVASNRYLAVSNATLIEHLCKGFFDQPFRIQFHDDIPRPAYKDKSFTLRGSIVDKDNKVAKLQEPMIFNAILYKAEHPITQIELTRYNEKIIIGNPVIETTSVIYFRKLFIKEVSSYHPSKMYILVIMPEDIKLVQPYVFPEVVVKTKNLKPCKLRKKFKLDEFSKL